ncbi:MAG: zinc-ribbon domain-containing protein [Lachnospiraceae bacterium]|nr:zinc-ribbon domain-containing protein [Lachnospiraceae bacterium]
MTRYKAHIIDNAHLMTEWDWDENEKCGLDPRKLTIGSGKKANWICPKGHKWATSIYHRVQRGSNCPYCSNKKVLPGYNDLQSQRPDLMAEWDYEMNTIDPSTVAVKSNKDASWVCPKGHQYTKKICNRADGAGCSICAAALRTSFPEQCFFYYIKKVYPDAINSYRDIFDNGMEWPAQIYNRANGKGCPCCAHRIVVPGINDLATTDPDLAEEWHPTMNSLKPTEVTRGQAKKAYWICSKCGNVWQDTLNHRSQGRGCSICKKKNKLASH